MVTALPTLYTEKEVAALFGCAPITVKRERVKGRLGWSLGWPSWLLNRAGKCRRAAAAEKQCDLFSANAGEA